jgi:hypothetical protein
MTATTTAPEPPLYRRSLRAGALEVRVDEAELPLDELCGFASRRSRKRGFVFVSKVLGKHYPVRPRLMEEVHARLAAKVADVRGPAVLVAMAETATGLGHGVFEQLLQRGRDDLLFLHTTRYRLRRPLALHFEECHSHATEHLLYEPADAGARALFRAARTLVLVDDEISTGRTLGNLAAACRRVQPRLESVRLVCLTDWLGAGRKSVEERTGLPVTCASLLRGGFTFVDDERFDPGPIPDVVGRGDCKDEHLGANFGRLGLSARLVLDLEGAAERLGVRPGERVLVLGTGEFSHAPFRLARLLEERGAEVWFQSTTRSPLLPDGDLRCALEFRDNYHDDIPNYLYNVAVGDYNLMILCYETDSLPTSHQLPRMLGAACLFFSVPGRVEVRGSSHAD